MDTKPVMSVLQIAPYTIIAVAIIRFIWIPEARYTYIKIRSMGGIILNYIVNDLFPVLEGYLICSFCAEVSDTILIPVNRTNNILFIQVCLFGCKCTN